MKFKVYDDPCRKFGGKRKVKRHEKPLPFDLQTHPSRKKASYKQQRIKEFMQQPSESTIVVFGGIGFISTKDWK